MSAAKPHHECERKFLVTIKGGKLNDFNSAISDVVSITQYYIEGTSERIRTSFSNALEPKFEHTVKVRQKDGSSLEYNTPLTREQFSEKLSSGLFNLKVDKVRYMIPYKDHTFEVDSFIISKFLECNGVTPSTFMLEVELPSMDSPFIIPKFFEVLREVTFEPEFKNSNLGIKFK